MFFGSICEDRIDTVRPWSGRYLFDSAGIFVVRGRGVINFTPENGVRSLVEMT